MIKTGYIRRIDDLGRIVIPKEIRKIVFGTSYTDGKPMEIFTENGTVVLSPYEPVDVQIVRHGHWYLLDHCSNEGVYCSVCNKKVYSADYANQKLKSKYCPNCGSKMDFQEMNL